MSSAIHSLADQESKPRPTLIAPEETARQLHAAATGADRELLTIDGGRWALTAELRQLCALTAGGELYLSQAHQTDAYVLAFMDRLERAGVDFTVKLVTMSVIKGLYDAEQRAGTGLAAAGANSTQRQLEVIRIMGIAHQRGASDIHFLLGHEITKIRFREHGRMTNYSEIPTSIGLELCSALYNSMCDVSEEHYQPETKQDARVSRRFVDQLGLFGARVATRPKADGPMMVLRLLYDDQTKRSVEDLGFLPEHCELLQRVRTLPYGINLFTGPTGSGKSKSMQVMINLMAEECQETKHILTVEDPPEYPINANQTALGADETWADAITNSMRLDPDILMYGEMRDLESAKAAYRGAMTGHLVLSTLHTNNAIASLQRLVDLGVDQSLATDPALTTGIINQSLVPVLCPHCRIPLSSPASRRRIDSALFERLASLIPLKNVHLLGDGCDNCRGLGIVTRTVVAEILLPTHRFMQVFRDEGASEARNYWVKELGGVTKLRHTLMKIAEGLVDPVMAEKVVGPLDNDRYVLEHAAGKEADHAG